jgi:hypothetical protein
MIIYFIRSLFNDPFFSNLHYSASNERVISEYEIKRILKEAAVA